MTSVWLGFQLVSDAAFGSGAGVSGYVDVDVPHDERGLPYLSGRSLKGLLRESAAEILCALERQSKIDTWHAVAADLFGVIGADPDSESRLFIGRAELPVALAEAVRASNIPSEEVLYSLTTIRAQTAVDPWRGTPLDGSLRRTRVVLKETRFFAPIVYRGEVTPRHEAFLAACVLRLRRAGISRNRGFGKLKAQLYREDNGRPASQACTEALFLAFVKEVATCTQ